MNSMRVYRRLTPPAPRSASMESVRLNTDREDTGDERSMKQTKKLRYGIIGASVVCTVLAVCFFALRNNSFYHSQEMADASQVELAAEADRLETEAEEKAMMVEDSVELEKNYTEFVQDEGKTVSQELSEHPDRRRGRGRRRW